MYGDEPSFFGDRIRCKKCGWETNPRARPNFHAWAGIKIHMSRSHNIKLKSRYSYAQKHQGHLFKVIHDVKAEYKKAPGLSFSSHEPPYAGEELFKGPDIRKTGEDPAQLIKEQR